MSLRGRKNTETIRPFLNTSGKSYSIETSQILIKVKLNLETKHTDSREAERQRKESKVEVKDGR